MKLFQNKNRPIIAHRGANQIAPENTLAAFELAYQMGAEWVECDVVLTQDEIPVILHDRNLLRTTGRKANIDGLQFEDLKHYDAGFQFYPNYQGTNIPTLKALLDLALKQGKGINLEIKPAKREYAERTAEIVRQMLRVYEKKIPLLISSFEFKAVKWYAHYASELPLGFLMSRWDPLWEIKISEFKVFSIHCNEKILNEKRVQALKLKSQYVLAYTVNDLERAKELQSFGVDGFFSDNPHLYQEKPS